MRAQRDWEESGKRRLAACAPQPEGVRDRRGLVEIGSVVSRVYLWSSMFQIIFNELSAAEISALPKSLQLELLTEFQVIPEDLDHLDPKRFGIIEREGKKLYRYRAKDYRIYFDKREEGITIHRVLHKNTLKDFLFRSKLPVAEDQQLGKTREFWKLIEQGERTGKA
jgi:mRNA-degrading endonuclease RelE of RelBE toxin-antitoxin system